jgi:hypothetical protein
MTQQEQIRAHNKDRALKIKQERKLEKELIAFFIYVLRYFMSKFTNGSMIKINDILYAILLKHYERINVLVTSELYSVANTAEQGRSEQQDSNAAFSKLIVSLLAVRTGVILHTLMSDFKKVQDKIEGEASLDEKLKETLFKQHAEARRKLIAVTETQNAVESKKYVIASESQAKKSWVTILDGRERKWHGDAFGQTVNTKELFIVNGESLLYPGDTMHGATASNICNCRCSAIYF